MHPLKISSLLCLLLLLLTQLGLLGWLDNDNRFLLAGLLCLPLLAPVRGLLKDRIYTYKWTGFLCLIYLVIGVSESFADGNLRIYSLLNIVGSLGLFFTSIYYTRYLRTVNR